MKRYLIHAYWNTSLEMWWANEQFAIYPFRFSLFAFTDVKRFFYERK